MTTNCGFKGCKTKPAHGSRRCKKHKGRHWKSVRKLAIRGGRRTRVKAEKRKKLKTRGSRQARK